LGVMEAESKVTGRLDSVLLPAPSATSQAPRRRSS
jgi:hypothetical protein